MCLSKNLLPFYLIVMVACGGGSSEPMPSNNGGGTSNPLSPNPLATGSIAIESFDGALNIHNGYLYVTGSQHGVAIIDISSPADLIQVGNSSNPSSRIVLEGDRAYASVGQDVFIYDISNLSQMVFLNSLNISMDLRSLSVENDTLYVGASASNPFSIFDVSDPLSTLLVGNYFNDASTHASSISADKAFLADFTHFRVLDISNQASISLVSEIELFPATVSFIELKENLALLSGGGFHIIDLTDINNPVLLSTTAFTDIPTVWSPISLASTENVVYLGVNAHIKILDISDPLNPIEIGDILTSNLIMDIILQGTNVYVLLEDFPCNASLSSSCRHDFIGVESYDVSGF